MIVALAGRRIDAPDASPPGFPLDHVPRVRERLAAFFAEHQVRTLVCAAACGADLLALEVAGELGLRRRVVLPFPPPEFRARSVTDRPGDWGPLYDRILDEVRAAGDLVLLPAVSGDESAFARANEAILDEAVSLAGQALATPGSVLAAVVWDQATHGEDDMTSAFAQAARRRHLPVAEVLTL